VGYRESRGDQATQVAKGPLGWNSGTKKFLARETTVWGEGKLHGKERPLGQKHKKKKDAGGRVNSSE